MCRELCDSGETCPDCGRMICLDVQHGDDIMRPAYITASADLYCDQCGRQHDQAEEERDQWEEQEYRDAVARDFNEEHLPGRDQ